MILNNPILIRTEHNYKLMVDLCGWKYHQYDYLDDYYHYDDNDYYGYDSGYQY